MDVHALVLLDRHGLEGDVSEREDGEIRLVLSRRAMLPRGIAPEKKVVKRLF
jgi:hypothetical protein